MQKCQDYKHDNLIILKGQVSATSTKNCAVYQKNTVFIYHLKKPSITGYIKSRKLVHSDSSGCVACLDFYLFLKSCMLIVPFFQHLNTTAKVQLDIERANIFFLWFLLCILIKSSLKIRSEKQQVKRVLYTSPIFSCKIAHFQTSLVLFSWGYCRDIQKYRDL